MQSSLKYVIRVIIIFEAHPLAGNANIGMQYRIRELPMHWLLSKN